MISLQSIDAHYTAALRRAAVGLGGVSGVCVLAMMGITCADVAFRLARMPMRGAYDLVSVVGAVAMASALPYITAIKGHVAIEFFFNKLDKRGRVIVDTLMRLVSSAFFLLLARECVSIGVSLRKNGQVSTTLQLPLFWVPWVIAFCCVLTALVILYHLTHSGKPLAHP